MESFKVFLKEVHWQEVHVYANSREDAIKRARDGDGDYVGATTYDHTIETITEHRVEEL